MILQVKVILLASIYSFGVLFMILYPPRNYDQSGTKMRKVRSAGSNIKYREYIDYDTMVGILKHMASEDSDIAEIVHLTPTTSANNGIIALELHSDTHSKKPGVLVVSTLNGMVWGGPNAVIELAEKLIYDTNYQTPFFNDYDWYFIPLANPDALKFTTHIRTLTPVKTLDWSRNLTARNATRPAYWNKNMESPQKSCFGTNINRNFAYHWQDGVSKKTVNCSQYYPGSKPFSSAEAQAIRSYIDKLADVVHLAIHLDASFVPKKEFILYPWRYTLRQPSNFRTLQEIGEYAARQARLPDGRLYEVHQSSSDERIAGSLSDYMTGVVGIELVFLVKPYHDIFPNYTDSFVLESYVKKSISAILSLVRGWRSNTKQNTLSFFGEDVEF